MATGNVSALDPSAWTLISTTTIATSAITQTISGLNGVYKELRIAWKITSGNDYLGLRFNGDSNDNYSGTALTNDFLSTVNQTKTAIWLSQATASTHIGYADWENCNLTVPKICTRALDTAGVGAAGGIYVGSSAISSVSLVNLNGGNINSGGTIWLWGKI
jgi:hypothetical protein